MSLGPANLPALLTFFISTLRCGLAELIGLRGWTPPTGSSSRILTDRLDELRRQLDEAEAANQIAAIYALEEALAEAEAMREQMFSRLVDRVADDTAT
jgi:hypothetical protein